MSTDATRRTMDTTVREFHTVQYAELVVQRAWRRERHKEFVQRALRYLAAPVIGFCVLEALGLWASHLLGQPFPWGFSVIAALAMLEAAVEYESSRAETPATRPDGKPMSATPDVAVNLLPAGPNDGAAAGGDASPPDSHREVA
jgi:hypothetical protein